MKKQIIIEKYIQPSIINKNAIRRVLTSYFTVEKEEKFFVKEWHNNYGELHSFFNQPAKIYYTVDGEIIMESWYNNGYLHRDNDKPAIINCIDENCIIKTWYKNGEQFRYNNEPSEEYFSNGVNYFL